MKKMKCLLLASAALMLNGCFFAPQMRMSEPSDSSEYNGISVYFHSIDEGDFGTDVKAAPNGDTTANYGDLADLIVDSLPKLEYRIGPLDMVQVVVWEHPELTSPMGQYQPAGQKVTTDGKLFYPYAGELQAAGLTAQELRQEITKRLSDKILNDPQVDVRVSEYNSLKAVVSGEVKNPGYAFFSEAPMTIPMAIAEVGGFNQYADPAGMQLRRGDKVYKINYLEAFKKQLPLDKMLLKPDDQLYVPALSQTQRENRAYVMGEVQKVGLVDLVNGKVNLVEALSAAGGLQALNASSRSIYVIRNTSDKRIDVFNLNAKNAMALAMAERFDLDAHDIVYVDASGLATWNRFISLILPSVQTVYYGLLATHNAYVVKNDITK
ncbi:MAG: polysaccharide biosynthesis/export family protein [Fibrobacter sp.]|nr:polysaccharide biosynthesis/export family protein [Fibrobacter sp.]